MCSTIDMEMHHLRVLRVETVMLLGEILRLVKGGVRIRGWGKDVWDAGRVGRERVYVAWL
jgi:hypothetical protein